MKAVVLSLLLFAQSHLYANNDEQIEFQEMVISNSDEASPSCRVRFPANQAKCKGKTCAIPAPKRSSLRTISIHFSCIPNSARDGFENPPSDARIKNFKIGDMHGSVMLIDEIVPAGNEKMRELLFCLFGVRVKFCALANTMVLKEGASADASGRVEKFLKTIRLIENAEAID